jgi:activating signal cointegrator complex subunit 1
MVMPPLPRPLPGLLFHATVFNTVYIPGKSRRDRQRVEIDARALIEAFGEMVWMENIRVEELVLCRMGAKEVDGVERYATEGTVGMP